MITAVFFKDETERVLQLQLSGHAGSGPEGQDIVCAAVSGAAQFLLTLLDTQYSLPHCVSVQDGPENKISCDISKESGNPVFQEALHALDGFYCLMSEWEQDFTGFIQVKTKKL